MRRVLILAGAYKDKEAKFHKWGIGLTAVQNNGRVSKVTVTKAILEIDAQEKKVVDLLPTEFKFL